MMRFDISCLRDHRSQRGAVTIFTAVLILLLMTLMLFYAARVGLFEQRVSANDLRQKLAFQAAEAGLDYALEFMLARTNRMTSKASEATPYLDADGNLNYYSGWFAEGSTLWAACPDAPGTDHPCGGEVAGGATGSFYYDDPATTTEDQYDALPLDAALLGNLPPGTEVRVTAVICPRELGDPTCLGDAGISEPDDTDAPPMRFSIWLLAYGYSDCNDNDADGQIDLPDECSGRANVARPVGSLGSFNGSPNVPLVSKNSIPAQGTAEVVPNPNGGGEGVPLSIWSNDRPNLGDSCPPLDPDGSAGDALSVQGSFKTCELHEWYGVDARPDNHRCNQPTCQCDYPGPEPISYRQGADEVIGIDVISDPLFPCDLFQYYFGYPSSEYQAVKSAATVIDDCSVLNEASEGFFWFSGSTCTLGNVGTINNPVILVSAADSLTRIGANNHFYGILYLANVEDPDGDAAFQPGGGATVYGAVIVDVLFNTSGAGGTFRIVYDEVALMGAGGAGGIGRISGGWHDFGLPQFNWEP
jgi:hypothetical protein